MVRRFKLLLFRACNVIEKWIRGKRTQRWIETGKFERLGLRKKKALIYINKIRRWCGGDHTGWYEVYHTLKTTESKERYQER